MSLPCFNPLPHAEGDVPGLLARRNSVGFNPLPHAEGDDRSDIPAGPVRRFNPLPHAEGDVSPSSPPSSTAEVSIHSLTQRETLHCTLFPLLWGFQSTPSRRGRPFFLL